MDVEQEDDPDIEEEDARVTVDWSPDLHWLTEQLAVGGCFPIERAAELREQYGIGAVVDLRGEDRDDERRLRDAGIAFLHLPTPDLEPASLDMLERGVAFVRERMSSGDKVLIHCQHGVGRSALLALCVLVDHGWAPLDALGHAKDRRAAVSPSRSQFDGWAAWLKARGVAPPDYHSFGCIAYRHLASS
jgi:hypothetical protein